MDAYMYGAGGMFPCNPEYPHSWVKASEVKAEIARLQAEAERTNDVLESQAHVIRDLRAKLDTIHNAAIEKAAYLFTHPDEEGIADRIWELKE